MKKSSAILLVVLAISLLLQSLSLAWISDNGLSSPVDITANVHKNYFEYGNGSVEEPYGIASPVQLYYFSWLQYLGYFNPDDNGDHVIDRTYYFELANDIDMEGIVLPPIGTLDNPFISNFDGQGFTVSNLVIKNLYGPDLTSPPKDAGDSLSGVEIVGFFGVVGSLEGDTSYTYKTEANEVKNLALENVTIVTQTEKSLIGLVAGYVNGTVDCVGVLGGTINIADGVTALTYTENISDYSLIGFCTKDYKDSVYVMDITISQPGVSDSYNVVPDMTSGGEGPGWGGSIAMKSIFEMIQGLDASTNVNYITQRTDVVFSLDGLKTITVEQSGESRDALTLQDGELIDDVTQNPFTFGSFVFTTQSGWNGNEINFINGSTKVTKFTYAYTENNVALYYITDGEGNYLSFNGTDIINSTAQADATKWYVSNGTNGGSIYTVIDGIIYYLTISNNSIITTQKISPKEAPTWSVESGDLRFDSQKIECENGTWRIATSNIYLISSGTRYLSVSVGNNGNVSINNNVTNSENATEWTITESGNNGRIISTIVNGIPYYLGATATGTNRATLTLTETQTIWTYNATNNQFSVSIRYSNRNRTYYIRYNNGWVGSNSGSNLTLRERWPEGIDNIVAESSGETARGITYKESAEIDNALENYYYDESGAKVPTANNPEDRAGITYIPLSFDIEGGEYSIRTSNTGYIIGSEWDTTTYDDQDGEPSNLRISQYQKSNITSPEVPYIISYKTENKKFIELTSDIDPKAQGLVKYENCYGDYYSSLAENCYGLHFMDAPIFKDNVAEITAYLNGRQIPNYQVPTNCIDFNLYDRGFINAFAGTYYSMGGGNTSFFSLYEVFRDPQDETKIVDIKEIESIYAALKNGEIDTSKKYVYTYTDGTSSETIPEDYEEVFDCDWIMHTKDYCSKNGGGWETNRAYYFEIPVNAGEYAIGSTEDETGAYLVYLDLAANAQIIERQKDYEQIVEEKYAGSLPKGVELLAPGETLENGVDPKDSAFVSINAAGEIVFSTVDGVTITHTAKDGTSAEYIGPNNTLLDGNGVAMTMPSERTTIYKTTYRDHNLNTGEYTVTVITETHKSDGTVDYERTITKGTWNSETNAPENMGTPETKKSDTEKLYPTTKDTTENQGGGAIGADLVGLYFAYGQKDSLAVKYEYVYDATNPTYNITITVTNEGGEDVDIEDVDVKAVLKSTTSGVTVYINGQELESTTDPQIVTVTVTSGGDATQ